MLTIDESYHLFVEEKTKHIISRNHVAVVDDDKQSIFVEHSFRMHKVQRNYTFSKELYQHLHSLPYFCFGCDISTLADQHFSHHERYIHFRASDGQHFALRVRSYPDQHNVVFRLGYFYLEPTKGIGYEFREMHENHIWHGLSSRRDELITRLLYLPEFRLLRLTNLLVVDDKKFP